MSKRKRTGKNLAKELNEIDYLDKLSPEEREWAIKFYREYYQGDFEKDNTIHPPELIEECYIRNNTSMRQLHSVGRDLLLESAAKARRHQKNPTYAPRYYTPEDYDKEYPVNRDAEEDE